MIFPSGRHEIERFRNRRHAGRVLASRLTEYAGRDDVIVLGLPRGGVPVAVEVAHGLGAPLDVFVVRKLGVPGHEELAMGAIASGGIRVLNDEVIGRGRIPDAVVERVSAAEQEELARREALYRGDRPAPELAGKVVILVDDGLATGSTMRAAIAAVKLASPQAIVVAVPTAAAFVCRSLEREVDRVVCALTPEPFQAVGLWYEDFSQTTDHEIRELLDQAARRDRS